MRVPRVHRVRFIMPVGVKVISRSQDMGRRIQQAKVMLAELLPYFYLPCLLARMEDPTTKPILYRREKGPP